MSWNERVAVEYDKVAIELNWGRTKHACNLSAGYGALGDKMEQIDQGRGLPMSRNERVAVESEKVAIEFNLQNRNTNRINPMKATK